MSFLAAIVIAISLPQIPDASTPAAVAELTAPIATSAGARREEPAAIASQQAEQAVREEPQDAVSLLSVLDLDFHLGPWTFHGYFQYDAASYDQSAERPPEEDFRRGAVGFASLSARNLEDGVYLRRARLGGEGSFGKNIAYRAMFELGANESEGEPRISEVWVSYNRFAPYVIQAGAFPQPVNMDAATSSDSTLFLERATAADLAESLGAGEGRIGVTVKRVDKRWMIAGSLTGPQIDHAEDYSPRSAVVARVSRAVSWLPEYSIHVGVNGTYVLSPGKKKTQPAGVQAGFPVRLQNTPEVDVDDTRLIDTGDIVADHASVIGVEFAAQRKNLYLQAEAFRFGAERHDAPELSDPNFSGFYIQGSWILSGEARRFDQSRAAFWFPKPANPLGAGGWGAWELAFRFSRADLNYRAGAEGEPASPESVRGGRQDIWSSALLWYPRPRVRLMFNYLHVAVDRLNPAGLAQPEPFGPPPGTPPIGVQIGQTMNVAVMRARYSF